jgi:hypothetical protein
MSAVSAFAPAIALIRTTSARGGIGGDSWYDLGMPSLNQPFTWFNKSF